MLFPKNFFILLCIFSSTLVVAQIDTNKGGTKSNKIKFKAKVTTAEKPEELNPTNTNGFKTAHKDELEELKKKKEEEQLKYKGVITPELNRKIQFNKFVEKHTLQIPMIDKNIGSFKTKSANMILFAFDFGRYDGDRVSVLNNGKVIYENILLLPSSQINKLKIPLVMGFNKVEIIAVNEGRLRPNTGAFNLQDDQRKEVFSDTWQLAKGAKVIGHVIRIPDSN
jgi:hypothetical protein